MICDNCAHKDMCKWKGTMSNFINSMMSAQPKTNEEETEFLKSYFTAEFGCKKFAREILNPRTPLGDLFRNQN